MASAYDIECSVIAKLKERVDNEVGLRTNIEYFDCVHLYINFGKYHFDITIDGDYFVLLLFEGEKELECYGYKTFNGVFNRIKKILEKYL